MSAIAQLADDLIPSGVYGQTDKLSKVLSFYSPSSGLYLITQQKLYTDAKLIDIMCRANKQRERGVTVDSWKVDYETHGGNEGQVLSGNKLLKLYDFYRDFNENVVGSRTYNYSVGVTQMISGWKLVGAKFF